MKSAFVFLADGFEDVEAITPIDYLRRSGVVVTVVGICSRTVVSGHHLSVLCDKTLKELDSSFLPDLAVLPGGGKGSENLASSRELKVFISRMLEAKHLVGAICAAPAVVLGAWGLLEGRAYTCFPRVGDHLASKPLKKRVVVDLNLITAQAAGVAEEFSLSLISALCGPSVASEIADSILAR